MRRYLVYDSACTTCSHLANVVRDATGDKLEAISIRDDRTKALLDRAFPSGWKHAPYFLTEDGTVVRAWDGTQAAFRLALLAGPLKAFRLWHAAYRAGASVPGGGIYNASRRRFLRVTAAAAAAIGAAGLTSFQPRWNLSAQPASAQYVCYCCSANCDSCCYYETTGIYCYGCISCAYPGCGSIFYDSCDNVGWWCPSFCYTNGICNLGCDGAFVGNC
jgi:predicted DCC family thiol-disulfide oxidoreductase YuxK